MNLLDIIKKGSTDRSVTLEIIDSGDGTPETGVVFNTAGIDLWYRREGAAKVSITEATLAALTTAHTDGGFLHISDGSYRLDVPDAAFASGANHVDFGGTVTGMVVLRGRVRLVNFDLEDAARMGMTSLPAAAADAAGGLPISDAGGLDLDAKLAATNEVTAARMAALTDWINGGRLDLLIDAIKAKSDNLPADPASQTNIDTLITRIPNTLSLANINAEVDTALTDYDPPTHAELISEINDVQGNIAALNNLDAAGVAGAVWNAATASYGSADSYGLLDETNLDAAVSSAPTAAAIADAVLDEAMSGHVTAGSLGKALADVLVDTNELQIDWVDGGRLDLILDARSSQSTLDVIDGIVDSILADTGTDGVVLAAAQRNKIADHVLRRSSASAAASSDGDTLSFRSLLGAARKLHNKVAVVGTTLSIYDETDAGTAAGTQAVTSDAAAEPITAVDTN